MQKPLAAEEGIAQTRELACAFPVEDLQGRSVMKFVKAILLVKIALPSATLDRPARAEEGVWEVKSDVMLTQQSYNASAERVLQDLIVSSATADTSVPSATFTVMKTRRVMEMDGVAIMELACAMKASQAYSAANA